MSHQPLPWRYLRENPRRYDSDGEATAAALSHSREATEMTFDARELWKRLMFGVITGGVTGVAFGMMDAHRVTSNAKFAKETMRTKSREAIRLVSLSGSLFGAWFGAYNAIKYGAKLFRKEDDFFNVFIAGGLSVVPLIPFPLARQRLPYTAMLIGVDALNNHIL